MKKIISFILIICMSLSLTSCYQDLERNSLEEYIAQIKRSGLGFSSLEIDHPDYFLPNISFIEDYEYLEGSFFEYEDDVWKELFAPKDVFPDIVILALKYDESTYDEAKQTMLDEIKPHDNEVFQYNDYTFYVNHWKQYFPENFTMACYNDENCTLIFMGFHSSYPRLDEKYLEDIEGNWEAFVDQYYGAYYDFSQ